MMNIKRSLEILVKKTFSANHMNNEQENNIENTNFKFLVGYIMI